jgi:hypothetical protein
MDTYGLLFITVATPFLVFALGRPGIWASGGMIALFLLARGICHVVSHQRSLRAFERGHCIRCGYDTRASSGRCPECGDELISHASTYWRSFLR